MSFLFLSLKSLERISMGDNPFDHFLLFPNGQAKSEGGEQWRSVEETETKNVCQSSSRTKTKEKNDKKGIEKRARREEKNFLSCAREETEI